MLKMITAGFIIFATTAFGMSLSKLNSAKKAELTEIKGIGDTKADAIIKERKSGKFKSFDGLVERVKGIGDKMADNIKNDIKSSTKPKKEKTKKKKPSKTKATPKKEKKKH